MTPREKEAGNRNATGHLARDFKKMDMLHFFERGDSLRRAKLAQWGLAPALDPAVAMAFSRGKVWRATGRFGTRLAGFGSSVGEPTRLGSNCEEHRRAA